MTKLLKWIVFGVKFLSIILPIIGHTIASIKEEYKKLKESE